MRKIIAIMLMITIFALFAPLQAQGKEPTQSDIDAFIDAYGVVESLRITTEENVAFLVESGKLSPLLAACIKEKAPFEDVRKIVGPIVAKSFTDPARLRETTAFFSSPAGKKMTEYNFGILREIMRRSFRGLTPPQPGLPPSFTAADIQATEKFSKSPAGVAFSRFVNEGLPQIQKINILQDTYNACIK